MKTKDAIKAAGSAAELARILNITPSAVSQWDDDIPDLQEYRLKDFRPDWFKKAEPDCLDRVIGMDKITPAPL